MTKDTTHSIFHSAKRFFSGTMISRVSGMLRDVAMAFAFGTQDAVAAFMVAFRFSHLLRRLFGEGALQTAFIPQFESLRKDDPQRAYEFFSDLIKILSAGLSILIVLVMSVLGGCLLWIDLSAGNREIIFLTILMLPSLLFICLFGLNASLLQCERSYFTTGVAPVAFNVVWIIGVFCIWQLPIESAMPWLSGFVIIACLCQWLITVPKTLEVLKKSQISRPWHYIKWRSQDISAFAKPLCLGIFGVAASQINNALDAIFARYADLEGPALLWYALRIQQLPLALFGIAIAGALLPPLTRALKSEDRFTYLQFLEFAIRRSFALMLVISIGIFVIGDSVINLIYGHGDFKHDSIIGTTQCLWGYGIGLVPMTLVLILAPAFYARGDYKTPTIAATLSMVLNIVLNTFFITVMGLGAASIAVATSISAGLNCIILAFVLRADLSCILTKECLVDFAKVILAACVAGIVTSYFGSNLWNILQGSPVIFTNQIPFQLSFFCLQAFVFTFVLYGMAWFLQARDITLKTTVEGDKLTQSFKP